MKVTIRKAAIIAASTFACAALFSPGWSEQGGVSLSIDKAQAQPRVYIRSGYFGGYGYVDPTGLPWYAVRAYYYGGPWSGPGYSYAGWEDYATRNGIGCRPGTAIKGGDGILYLCQ
jgi:hypothetical protein